MTATITVIEAQLRTKLAATVTDWLIRWPNENWPSTIALSTGNAPLDDSGNPAPFIEAEVIGGPDTGDIAPQGQRHSTRIGIMRVYLCVPQGSGLSDCDAKADAIATAFKRQTVYIDGSIGDRLITMDVRIDDGIATTQNGDRFVRMCSIPWIFDYYQ